MVLVVDVGADLLGVIVDIYGLRVSRLGLRPTKSWIDVSNVSKSHVVYHRFRILFRSIGINLCPTTPTYFSDGSVVCEGFVNVVGIGSD